jgi:protocatechuate 3,4-dioxygenase beta subunit
MSMKIDRRKLLKILAAAPAAATGFSWALAAAAKSTAAGAGVGLITGNVCMLTPEVTEGPYYLNPGLVRADIREDRPGIPMKLRLQVVTQDCQPVEGARVDIWHCDAQGNYSGYSSQGSDARLDTSGKTFLRGTQMTDSVGIATFQTIYPGWYASRTVHIHFKVFLDKTQVLTGQIFFPDALSQYIFENAPAYGGRSGKRDMVNINDGIAQQAGEGSYAAVREQTRGYDAALVVGIDPKARSMNQGGPDGKRPPLMPAGNDGMPNMQFVPGGPSRSKDWTPVEIIRGAGKGE